MRTFITSPEFDLECKSRRETEILRRLLVEKACFHGTAEPTHQSGMSRQLVNDAGSYIVTKFWDFPGQPLGLFRHIDDERAASVIDWVSSILPPAFRAPETDLIAIESDDYNNKTATRSSRIGRLQTRIRGFRSPVPRVLHVNMFPGDHSLSAHEFSLLASRLLGYGFTPMAANLEHMFKSPTSSVPWSGLSGSQAHKRHSLIKGLELAACLVFAITGFLPELIKVADHKRPTMDTPESIDDLAMDVPAAAVIDFLRPLAILFTPVFNVSERYSGADTGDVSNALSAYRALDTFQLHPTQLLSNGVPADSSVDTFDDDEADQDVLKMVTR